MRNPAVTTKPGRLPSRPIDEADALIVLHPADHVAIAKQPLLPGTRIRRPGGAELIAGQLIPSGHKLAISALRRGAAGSSLRADHRLRREADQCW